MNFMVRRTSGPLQITDGGKRHLTTLRDNKREGTHDVEWVEMGFDTLDDLLRWADALEEDIILGHDSKNYAATEPVAGVPLPERSIEIYDGYRE